MSEEVKKYLIQWKWSEAVMLATGDSAAQFSIPVA